LNLECSVREETGEAMEIGEEKEDDGDRGSSKVKIAGIEEMLKHWLKYILFCI
jgi:hypothetical protein